MNANRRLRGESAESPVNDLASARSGLASIRYVLVVFAVLFVAATVLCAWLLVTSPDAIFVVFGSAAFVGAVGTGFAVRAVRIGLDGLSVGPAGTPQIGRARKFARTAMTGLLFGALVPVLIALAMVLTNHGDAALALLTVMGALVLGMWSMAVDTCRKLLDRASSTR